MRLARRCRSFSSFSSSRTRSCVTHGRRAPVVGSPLSRRPQPPATPASSCRSGPRGCVTTLALLLLALPSSPEQLTAARRCRSFSRFRPPAFSLWWLSAVSASPPTTPASSCRSTLAATSTHFWPSCCSRSRLRPSNCGWQALPLLLFVLFLAHAFLREARQEGPLVPPTLPWQVELSEGPPPAPPLLRRRPHNKTHFPLHRLS